MLSQIHDTGITIDAFYVFLRIVEIVLELALLMVALKINYGTEIIKRAFLVDGPKEIVKRIVEKLAETKVTVTATGAGTDPEVPPETATEELTGQVHVPDDKG